MGRWLKKADYTELKHRLTSIESKARQLKTLADTTDSLMVSSNTNTEVPLTILIHEVEEIRKLFNIQENIIK